MAQKFKDPAALRAVPVEDVEPIRDAMNGSNSLLIAAAARLASERTLAGLQPELAAAFKRLLPGGVRSDKGCQAKMAICKALNLLGWEDDEVFLAGIRRRQPEPSYGGPIDTAATLRAECAVGLARVASPHRLAELTRLLLDPESEARAGAANALGIVGNETAEMLLRLKILTGDPDARVLGECFRTLLTIAGHSASGRAGNGTNQSRRRQHVETTHTSSPSSARPSEDEIFSSPRAWLLAFAYNGDCVGAQVHAAGFLAGFQFQGQEVVPMGWDVFHLGKPVFPER